MWDVAEAIPGTAGNLWGLQERIVAVRSLCALAQELRTVRRPLQELLTKSQATAVETFYSRTVEASGGPSFPSTQHPTTVVRMTLIKGLSSAVLGPSSEQNQDRID